jgi:hypothetical protein
MEPLTVPEKILVCAAELDQEKGTFTAEDLVVRCWQKFPDTFGLQGYADRFPDANRVLTNIMGGKGLRGKGWLRKVGEKRYHITEVGRQAAVHMPSENQRDAIRRGASLTRDTIEILARLMESRAFQKFRIGEDLTFSDLSSFWNVSARSNAYQLNVAIKEADAALQAAELCVRSEVTESLTLPGKTTPITKSDVAAARSLQNHLKERFWQDLDVIRERSDERLRR